MRNRSIMSKGDFLWENLFWGAVAFVIYAHVILLPLEGLSRSRSLLILGIGSALCLTAGILLTYKKRRNTTSVYVNILSPYVIYYIITNWDYFRHKLIIGFWVVGILTAAYCILVLVNYFRDRRASVSLRACLRACLLSCRTICVMGMSFVVFILCAGLLLGLPIIESNSKAELPESQILLARDDMFFANRDTLLLLDEERWAALDASQRLDVLKTVADIETAFLGISPVTVCSDPLDEMTLGHYNDATRTVTLNLDELTSADAKTMLQTTCHECYHAYQHRLIDLYDSADEHHQDLHLFIATKYYKKEFANYISGTVDPVGYSTQWCEQDSDSYAYSASRSYLLFLEDILDQEAESPTQ